MTPLFSQKRKDCSASLFFEALRPLRLVSNATTFFDAIIHAIAKACSPVAAAAAAVMMTVFRSADVLASMHVWPGAKQEVVLHFGD